MRKSKTSKINVGANLKKPLAEDEKFPRTVIPLQCGKTDEETRRNCAALLTGPELAAYRVINGAEQSSGLAEHIDVQSLLEALRDQAEAANRDNLKQAEAMLMNQATALQSLFARLAERGMGCGTIPGFEANMRMALRAQSQCRATLETLAVIKNPPVVYARQANIAHGPQQVNNGTAHFERRAHAGNQKTEQSKLLEAKPYERLDTGTQGATVGADPALETVGEIDRAEVGRREGEGFMQRF